MGLHLLYVVNDANFFLSHRLPLAKAAQSAEYDVHVATPNMGDVNAIRAAGFIYHPFPLTRSGANPWQEFQSVMALVQLYKRLQPDLVHHVTIKPVLYGGIAARIAGVPSVVNAVTGLGYVFIAKGTFAALRRAIVKMGYKLCFGHKNQRVIFQNPDDRAMFINAGIVAEPNTIVIKGSGVDMSVFAHIPEPEVIPLVVLSSRMLWDKGVGVFAEAAQLLHDKGVNARFVLVGGTDTENPAAVPSFQLEAWNNSGVVEWWGRREDMPEVFAQSHIVCLPSSYGEGVPKVLIEAAACGRPIVATDTPGCREIVKHGENGLLVPMRDAAALAVALRKLIEDPELRRRMGKKGRELAVAEFSVETVVNETLAIYRELIP